LLIPRQTQLIPIQPGPNLGSRLLTPPFTPTPGGLHTTTTSNQQLSSPHGRKNKGRAPIPAPTHLRRPPRRASPAPPALKQQWHPYPFPFRRRHEVLCRLPGDLAASARGGGRTGKASKPKGESLPLLGGACVLRCSLC
jgi:hypothetical protein